MVVQNRGRLEREDFLRGADGFALAAALLGLVWDIGPWLLVPGARGPSTLQAQLLAAIAYSALGFLPAVFVDTALRPWGHRQRAGSWIPLAGYALSTWQEPSTSIGFSRERPAVHHWPAYPRSRVLRAHPGPALGRPARGTGQSGWSSSLAPLAFGVCAFHLSSHSTGTETLSTAVFGHHASLPLIVAILYEDYRFAFADVFLKRAAAIILLAAVVLGLYLDPPRADIHSRGFARPEPHPCHRDPVWALRGHRLPVPAPSARRRPIRRRRHPPPAGLLQGADRGPGPYCPPRVTGRSSGQDLRRTPGGPQC